MVPYVCIMKNFHSALTPKRGIESQQFYYSRSENPSSNPSKLPQSTFKIHTNPGNLVKILGTVFAGQAFIMNEEQ